MKYLSRIWLVLAAGFLAACTREPVQQEQSYPELGITLEIPYSNPVKATEVPASEQENALHSLQIWVFNSTTKALVTHLGPDKFNTVDDFPQAGGGVKRYSMRVDWDFALNRPNVDVFVLANAESIGINTDDGTTLDGESSYAAVNDAVFGGDFFSPQAKVNAVPATGLPMSGSAKNLSIKGEAPSLSIATITLERMVSKVRFIFSQMLTETTDPEEMEVFSIESIELDGHVIPTEEFVFGPTHTPRWASTFVADNVTYPGTGGAAVKSSPVPELYKYAGQSGVVYEAIIESAKLQNRLTDCGTYYLRESGAVVTGKIHYKAVKGQGTASETEATGTALFSLTRSGDFARNHTWTVYGYYVSKRTLQLSVNVLPWRKTDYTINYSESSLMVTWKLSVLDGSYARKEQVSKDVYNIILNSNSPCRAYLYVATPEGGRLQVIPVGTDGSENAFAVSFSNDPQEEVTETDIMPTRNNGRIDIVIDRKDGYTITSSQSIQLSFKAFTAGGDSGIEIDGASECIDQIYNFIIPYNN